MTDRKLLEPASKPEWRRRMMEIRDGIDPKERGRLSARICEAVEAELLRPLRERLGRPLRIALFAAFKSEASPLALFERCSEAGDRTYATRMLGGGEGLELREVESVNDWSAGRWGVPEPDPSRTRPMDKKLPPDAVLVPGLAFDASGGRLGYGGGYYDRLYQEVTGRAEYESVGLPLWIGFAFSAQLVEGSLPAESHDLRLDAVATDEGVIRLPKESKGEA
ncbi:5-formyltetrahydrofolate cyclo-ligase [Cohnella suwonensis]|uniref:5-formyltetrahydrofolate cyclo-ligase n=1 Tax=Cohnella suwonensis TaxID=696072 RepID=A0ABW0M589_9BACL